MKIYIAGKITNYPQYKEHFARVEKILQDKGHKVMNPAVLPEGFTPDNYMSICLEMLKSCDCICLLSNWEDSRGAIIEQQYAKYTNKIIINENMLEEI